MASDVVATGFPRDLDGHPLLTWMGSDWVEFVTLKLLDHLQRQQPGTEMSALTCLGTPRLESRARDGTLSEVTLRVPLEVVLQDSSGGEHALRGNGTFTGGGLAQGQQGWTEVAFEIGEPTGAFLCVVCGSEAGRLRVDPHGELERRTFTGALTQQLSPAGAQQLQAAIAAADAAAVYALDPEFAPFYCPECRAVYCGAHMRRRDIFDEEAFHDSIRGTCPEGHERMLED